MFKILHPYLNVIAFYEFVHQTRTGLIVTAGKSSTNMANQMPAMSRALVTRAPSVEENVHLVSIQVYKFVRTINSRGNPNYSA